MRPGKAAPVAVATSLVLLALSLRLWNAFRGLHELLQTTLPDDAFYYFGIARYLALGHPPSIDGVSPTNGYHPLWMAMLVPVYGALSGADLVVPVRVAMVMGALLDAGSTALLFRICQRLGLKLAASAAATFYFAFNPYQVVNATCGLETAVALLLGLAAFRMHLGEGGPSAPAAPAPLPFGVALGLAVLARTDQAILALCLIGASGWALFRRAGLRTALRWAAIVSGVVVLVFVPWAAYSFRTTGTVVQSSGVALAFIHGRIPALWGFEEITRGLAVERTLASVFEGALVVGRWHGVPAFAAVVLLAVGLALVVFARSEERRALTRGLLALAPLLFATALLFLAHTAGRAVFREWYTAPFLAVSALLFGVAAEQLALRSRRPEWGAVALVVLLGVWVVHVTRGGFVPPYRQELAGTPGAKVREGHSDCGVVSYFTGSGITNLDGIVNQHALDALTRGELLTYVQSQRFHRVYVTDHYHSSVFFGPRYRESIVADGGDPKAVRVVRSPVEKDARIVPTDREVPLGSIEGREYLGEGWRWSATPRDKVPSFGPRAELLVYLPRTGDDVRLDLELSAAAVNDRGVQPVAVFLNDERVTAFEVTRPQRVYEIPLRTARPGRNRIRLDLGAPRARRIDAPYWWRSMDGNPLLGLDAYSLWLHGGTQEVHEISLADPSVGCSGCYGTESNEGRSWRWTKTSARVQLPSLAIRDKSECRLRISTAMGGAYRAAWNGVELPGAHGDYVIPREARARKDTQELMIHAAAFVPATQGDSRDQRKLGVALEKMRVVCW